MSDTGPVVLWFLNMVVSAVFNIKVQTHIRSTQICFMSVHPLGSNLLHVCTSFRLKFGTYHSDSKLSMRSLEHNFFNKLCRFVPLPVSESCIIMNLIFRTERSEQTRVDPDQEQSDQGLHCLPFHCTTLW